MVERAMGVDGWMDGWVEKTVTAWLPRRAPDGVGTEDGECGGVM